MNSRDDGWRRLAAARLIIGSNWFKGYSHTSVPKDHFILEYRDRANV